MKPSITPLATFKAYLPYDYIFNNEMPFAFSLEGDRDHVINQFEN